MAFVKQETIDNWKESLAEKDSEIIRLQGQIATAMTIIGEDGKDGVATRALRRVEELKQSGALDARALDGVVTELEFEETAKYIDSLREGLIAKHREDVARKIRINDGPRIRKELDEVFSTDGTYATIDAEIESSIRHDLGELLIAERRENYEAELTSPEAKEALIASLIEEMKLDGTFDMLRVEVKAALQEKWEDEARQALKDEITKEESAEEESFKQARMQELRGSAKYKNTKATIRKTLRTKWTEEANDCLAEDAKSEELANLVAERIVLEQSRIKELKDTIDASKLKDVFYGARGYDMDTVAEGTRVTIYLGEVAQGRLRVKGSKSNFMGRGDVNRIDREITMIATADKGHFCVVSDSLSESLSVYEQKAAIEPDTVITVGRKWVKNGNEVFNHSIADGVRMVFDKNTENPDFTDTYLPVVDLQIGDARASDRPNEHADSKAFKGLA